MRVLRVLFMPLILVALLLSGCGSSTDTASTTTAAKSTGVASSSASSSASAAATDCPTDNTRAFAKTRFVADVGLAAGTFHRYIYKPYKAGTFAKGADGRKTAIVKAGLTALANAKLLSNATKNAKANPTLCKTLAKPMSDLTAKMGDLKGAIATGNLAAIADVEALVQKVLSGSKAAGLDIQETTK